MRRVTSVRFLPAILAAAALLAAPARGAHSMGLSASISSAPGAGAGAVPQAIDQQSNADGLGLVREAFDLLFGSYIYRVSSADLLNDAWAGVNSTLTAAGLPPAARAPAFSGVAAQDWAAFATAYRESVAGTGRGGNVTPTDIAYGAIRQMANGRDSCHTAFLTPDGNANSAGSGRHQPTTDVGMVAGRDNNLVYRVYPGSPADRAGVRPGDTLLSSAGQGDPGIRRRIANAPAGKPIAITLRRPGVQQPITLAVAPEITTLPFIRTDVLPGGIGVIQWDEFTEGAGQVAAIRQAIDDFAAQGVVGWVLDLRTSPGGDAHTLAAIASLFMSQGRVSTAIDRAGVTTETDVDGVSALPQQLPLVVLVEHFSASAADILPGALQDDGRAYLIGEQTDGCIGSAILHTLDDGSGLQVEVEHVLVGNDELDLNGVGFTPNETIVRDAATLAAGRDPQMDRAVQYLLAQAAAQR